MFVENETGVDAHLARAVVDATRAVATLVTEVAYRAEGARLVRLDAVPARTPADPPSITRFPIWRGVSVTVAGPALCPAHRPFVRPVQLRVGEWSQRLIVFGDRVRERAGTGPLRASAPARFEAIELGFGRAFGGAYEIPPGLWPSNGLPHPGLRVAHAQNPGGVGLYPDEAAAVGKPLPNIEAPDRLIKKWDDAPEPAGFSPCAELAGLRLPAEGARRPASGVADPISEALALARDAGPHYTLMHHAPRPLIFPELAAGTPIAVDGLADEVLRITVPPSPTSAEVRGRGEAIAVRSSLRCLHLNAATRTVRVVYDHVHWYRRGSAPSWFIVRAAA